MYFKTTTTHSFTPVEVVQYALNIGLVGKTSGVLLEHGSNLMRTSGHGDKGVRVAVVDDVHRVVESLLRGVCLGHRAAAQVKERLLVPAADERDVRAFS